MAARNRPPQVVRVGGFNVVLQRDVAIEVALDSVHLGACPAFRGSRLFFGLRA